MPPLRRPDPFKRKGKRLPGQSDDEPIGGEPRIRVVERPQSTIINKELVRVGNVGAGDYIEIAPDGISFLANLILHVSIQADGDLFLGQDLSAPASTHLSVFSNNQTYNSESVEAGDMLLGDNSAGKQNLFWDASAGSLSFREGTTVYTLLIGGVLTLGDTSTEHINITSTAVQIKDGSTIHTQLSGGALTLGNTTTEHINITSTAIQWKDGATVYQELSGTTITVGLTTQDHANISSSGIQLKDSSVVKISLETDGDLFLGRDISSPSTTELAIFANGQTYNSESMGAGDLLLGDNTAEKKNMLWDASDGALKIRSGTTVYIELDDSEIVYIGDVSAENLMLSAASGFKVREGTDVHAELSSSILRLGQASNENVLISVAGGLKIREGSTVWTELSSSELQVGLQANENIRLTNSALQFRDGATVYAQLSATEWQLGSSSTEHIEIVSTAIRFKDGATVWTELSAGELVLGKSGEYRTKITETEIQLIDSSSVVRTELSSSSIKVGRASQDHVEITDSGIQLKDGATVKGSWETDGDFFLGRDVSAAATTELAVFANAQTYNSESMGIGDMLLGDNTAEKKNMLWDASDGSLKIRSGTTVYIELDDSEVVYIGDVSGENVRISTTTFRIREGTDIHAELSSSILRLGQASNENVLISVAGGFKIREGSTVWTELSSSELQVGLQATENIRITSSTLQFRDGATVYTELSAGELILGRPAQYRTKITSTAIQLIDDSAIVRTELSSSIIKVGRASQDHVEIADTGIQVKDGSTVRGEWQTDGDMFLGYDISDPAKTYLSVFANAQTYNSESVSAGDMLIGDNSASKANVLWDKSEGQLKFRGGTTTKLYLDTDGSLVAGAGDVKINSDGIVFNTGASLKVLLFNDGSDTIGELWGYNDVGTSGQVTLTARGKDSSTHEGFLQLIAITDDGAAHAGVASVTLELDTDNDRVSTNAGVFRAQRGAVFNDIQGDYDFRIEGDSVENLFFVDASVDAVGINTNSPDTNSVLDVNGLFKAQSAVFNDGQGNYDFRIESDNNQSMFFVDASADCISIRSGATPDTNAIMDMSGAGKPIIIPVMTTAQISAVAAAEGMLAFDSVTNTLEFYDGSAWKTLAGV